MFLKLADCLCEDHFVIVCDFDIEFAWYGPIIFFDLIFIEKCLLYGAKSPTYPICQFFISKKSVDKSDFVDKSGVDISEDALYIKAL